MSLRPSTAIDTLLIIDNNLNSFKILKNHSILVKVISMKKSKKDLST